MKTIIAMLSMSFSFVMYAQTVEDIDELFKPFDRKDHPAVAALFMNKGEVIYKKAFGSAHLDYETPATINTKFQLAGLSKHFTAFAVLLLEEQGRLKLSDDIRTYLPQLPVYPETITIRHLLSMTSGLADFWSLKSIAGWHEDDVFTQADAMKLICSMKPAFKPGADYIYSNTDQLLLAEIVSKAAGQSFASFLRDQVFDPLGMSNTLALDDFEKYIPNLAESYEQDGDGFKRSALNYGIVGPTNIYSTIDDLAKWELNLLNPTVGSEEMVQKLYTSSRLKDGRTINPTFGEFTYAQQLFHKERGIQEAYQMGSLGGYATSIFKFMDDEFIAIVLSSGIPYSGYLGMQTAYLFLDDRFVEPERVPYASLETAPLTAEQLERHTGTYWIEKSGYSRTISLKNDTLRYVRSDGSSSPLIPLDQNVFQMITWGDEDIKVSFSEVDDEKTMEFAIQDGTAPILATRQESYTYSASALSAFAGTYHCRSLQVVYELSVEDEKLAARNLKTGKITFTPIRKGLFEGDQWFFGSVRFDDLKNIKGFNLYTEGVRNLWFEKIESN